MIYLDAMPEEWPGEKLRKRRDELKLSTRELARAAGISQAAVGQYERGDVNIANAKGSTVRALADALEWSLEDLQRETGIDFGIDPKIHTGDRVTPVGYTMTPIMNSAKAGSPESYPVPNGVKRRPGTRVFLVDGDSMTPTFQDGDALLVDTNLTNVQDSKVYVLEVIGNGFCVKRARMISGQWLLDSDNPRHGMFRPDEVRVIGRVYKKLPAAEDVP
jgi:repressor LexA